MANYVKTDSDFFREFQMNIQSLQSSCDTYDQGNEFAVMDMATRLRVLLHDKNRNVSLFTHMGIKELPFVDSAKEIDVENILPQSCLIYMAPDEEFTYFKCYPILDKNSQKLVPFDSWWNQIVYSDSEKQFTRSDIVMHIADQDGGAHSDSKISMDYYSFSRKGNGIITQYMVDGQPVGESKYLDNLHFASLRQIAFEVLETLKRS